MHKIYPCTISKQAFRKRRFPFQNPAPKTFSRIILKNGFMVPVPDRRECNNVYLYCSLIRILCMYSSSMQYMCTLYMYVYMCMYMCSYRYMCICTCVTMYIYVDSYVYLNLHASIRTCARICIRVCRCIYIYIYTHAYVDVTLCCRHVVRGFMRMYG